MITGVDMNETTEYISVAEKDKENPTVYLIGPMSAKDRLVYMHHLESENPDPLYMYEVVKRSLRGIRKLKTKDGEQDFNSIDDSVMNRIRSRELKELFLQAVDINYLTEAETKN